MSETGFEPGPETNVITEYTTQTILFSNYCPSSPPTCSSSHKANFRGKILKKKKNECLSPGSNRGPLVCETSVITDYTTQTLCLNCGLLCQPAEND